MLHDPRDSQRSFALVNQGDLAREEGRWEDAVHFYRDALFHLERIQQDHGLFEARLTCSLGVALRHLSHSEAPVWIERSVRTFFRCRDAQHQFGQADCEAWVVALAHYTTCLREQGLTTLANPMTDHAHLVALVTLGPDHPFTRQLQELHPIPIERQAELLARHAPSIHAHDTAAANSATIPAHDIRPDLRMGPPRRPIRTPTGMQMPISKELAMMFHTLMDAFREKFGRDPGPGDPLFFDPEEDEPRPIQIGPDFYEQAEAMLAETGLDPAFLYAFRHTRVLVTRENRAYMDPRLVAAWDAAVTEYRTRHYPS